MYKRQGYGSHEAFTRAFKNEYGEAALRFRRSGMSAARTDRLNLTGEVIMGVVTTTLPEMTVVAFDGFKPEPEQAAFDAMQAWLDRHPQIAASSRAFGYNINRSGERSHDPDNEGYRLIVTVPDEFSPSEPNAEVLTENLGKRTAGSSGIVISDRLLADLTQRMVGVIDPQHGGIQGAPKFPQWSFFWMLWRGGIRYSNTQAVNAVENRVDILINA